MKAVNHITVETHPNGYGLDVDGNKYLYFTTQELVEGILVHVGLGINRDLNKQTIHDIMTACAAYPTNGDAVREASALRTEVDGLRTQAEQLREQIREQRELVVNTERAIRKAEIKVKRSKADAARLAEIERKTKEYFESKKH